jgi:hypothetical protein
MSLARILSNASRDWAELKAGVFLISQKKIREYQKSWADGDIAKNIDFSRAPFWVQEDAGLPFPVYTGHEIKELMK